MDILAQKGRLSLRESWFTVQEKNNDAYIYPCIKSIHKISIHKIS